MLDFVQSMCLLGVAIFVLLTARSNFKTNKILNDRLDDLHRRMLNQEYPQKQCLPQPRNKRN